MILQSNANLSVQTIIQQIITHINVNKNVIILSMSIIKYVNQIVQVLGYLLTILHENAYLHALLIHGLMLTHQTIDVIFHAEVDYTHFS